MRSCSDSRRRAKSGSAPSSFDELALTRGYGFCFRGDVDRHTIAMGTEGRYLVVLVEVVGLGRFGGGVLMVA